VQIEDVLDLLRNPPEYEALGCNKRVLVYPGVVIKSCSEYQVVQTRRLAAHLGDRFAKVHHAAGRTIVQERVEPIHATPEILREFSTLGAKDIVGNVGQRPDGTVVLYDGQLKRMPR
jgi:hypothetical protein